ncbi:hypothetical protein MiSe_76570 [Microseira wollei NIES-4236]|uniref:Uncharacterized protein n=2 Tax=Microseira wollei TaxID=467598 RepID=A0AAV3XQ21_9CYAN|nr:hypothetical protein MiSe_76570 [Microseira wollei NIES-4236]
MKSLYILKTTRSRSGDQHTVFCTTLILDLTQGEIKMALSNSQSLTHTYSFAAIKSFLIWTFALSVCLLVVGFPIVILMVIFGSLLSIVLQSVMPVSAVLLVAGALIGANLLAVMAGAAMLSAKGVHPNQVSWLRWMYGQENPVHKSVYAACPLTCDIHPSA